MSSAPSGPVVGHLRSLRRYPVKSLGGETLDRGDVEARGLHGDRWWALRDQDGKLGSGKSSARFRQMDGLLALLARYDGDVPVVEFGDGRVVRGDDPEIHAALSSYVGRPVTLRAESDVTHFDDGPLHLVTTGSLLALAGETGSEPDVRRFRPNLVIETRGGAGFVENDWVGRRVAVGDSVELRVLAPMPRCVMVTQAQRDLPGDPAMLRAVTAANGADLGVVADVLSPGPVAVGDEVRLLD